MANYQPKIEYNKDAALEAAELEMSFGVNGFLQAPEKRDGVEKTLPSLEQMEARIKHLANVLEELANANLDYEYEYRGYTTRARYSLVDVCLWGRIENIPGSITFDNSDKPFEQAFHEEVTEWIEWCEEEGIDPANPVIDKAVIAKITEENERRKMKYPKCIKSFFTYKGYVATWLYDEDYDRFAGRVINISDAISFHTDNLEFFEDAFKEAIDDYLLLCRKQRVAPSPISPLIEKSLEDMRPCFESDALAEPFATVEEADAFIRAALARAYCSKKDPGLPQDANTFGVPPMESWLRIKAVLKTDPEKNVYFETEDGKLYRFNAREYIFGPWMGELDDPDYFAKVKPYYNEALEWPNGQSIGPEDIAESSVQVDALP